MPTLPTFDPIQYLANRKYPSQSMGREDGSFSNNRLSEVYRKELAEIHNKADKYIAELSKKTKEEIESLVKQERKKAKEELKSKIEEVEAKRFFNQPDANADFEYWSKATYWSLDEAVALSFGKNPKIVNWESVKCYVGINSDRIGLKYNKSEALSYPSHFAGEYAKLRDLVLRAKNFTKLYDPVLPILFLNWIKGYEIDFPEELKKLVTKYNEASIDWKSAYENQSKQYSEDTKELNGLIDGWKKLVDKKEELVEQLKRRISIIESQKGSSPESKPEKPLNKKVEDTLLKLFIGMAAYSYGYDSINNNVTKASRISSDILTDTGISIDEDTVRKYLKQGRALLPELETEQN